MAIWNIHPLHATAADLVAGLRELENAAISKPRVLAYLQSVKLTADAMARYVFWRDETYTRNLIFRDELFEVLALCWMPGHKTPVHSHNGQLGWVTVLQGEILNHNYRHRKCRPPENRNVIEMDCAAGSRDVTLDRLDTTSCVGDGSVVTVDQIQSIHQMENAEKSRFGSISLHVYSKPIDSCVLFDVEKKSCERRTLTYYSLGGELTAGTPGDKPV